MGNLPMTNGVVRGAALVAGVGATLWIWPDLCNGVEGLYGWLADRCAVKYMASTLDEACGCIFGRFDSIDNWARVGQLTLALGSIAFGLAALLSGACSRYVAVGAMLFGICAGPFPVPANWVSCYHSLVTVPMVTVGLAVVVVAVRVWFIRTTCYVVVRKLPDVRPRRIRTKGVCWPVAIWRWLFSCREWEVLEDWKCGIGGVEIKIPAGFKFDGASIPRSFWFLLSPVGLLFIPGLIHDYGYRNDYLLRKGADPANPAPKDLYLKDAGKRYWDKLFLQTAVDVNGFHVINTLASYAVVVGGYLAWWQNRGTSRYTWWVVGPALAVTAASLVLSSGVLLALLVWCFVVYAIYQLAQFEFFTPLRSIEPRVPDQ